MNKMVTNYEFDTVGDRINATGPLTVQYDHAIDALCDEVYDDTRSILGDSELALEIARQCQVTAGRAMWDALFEGKDLDLYGMPLFAVCPDNCEVK